MLYNRIYYKKNVIPIWTGLLPRIPPLDPVQVRYGLDPSLPRVTQQLGFLLNNLKMITNLSQT